MKPNNYDLIIIGLLTAFRKVSSEKQSNLADLLNINQSEYCRIERGERALTLGQIKIICQHLRVDLASLIKMADDRCASDFACNHGGIEPTSIGSSDSFIDILMSNCARGLR